MDDNTISSSSFDTYHYRSLYIDDDDWEDFHKEQLDHFCDRCEKNFKLFVDKVDDTTKYEKELNETLELCGEICEIMNVQINKFEKSINQRKSVKEDVKAEPVKEEVNQSFIIDESKEEPTEEVEEESVKESKKLTPEEKENIINRFKELNKKDDKHKLQLGQNEMVYLIHKYLDVYDIYKGVKLPIRFTKKRVSFSFNGATIAAMAYHVSFNWFVSENFIDYIHVGYCTKDDTFYIVCLMDNVTHGYYATWKKELY